MILLDQLLLGTLVEVKYENYIWLASEVDRPRQVGLLPYARTHRPALPAYTESLSGINCLTIFQADDLRAGDWPQSTHRLPITDLSLR